MIPTLSHIREAQERVSRVMQPSPLLHSGHFSRQFGVDVYLKLENLQETGSFKIRGAYNRLAQLNHEERERGVVAASAGNHAQGVAWSAVKLGINATIVMPEFVSIKKLMAVKGYGAEIILTGANYAEAYSHAEELSLQTGKVLIPAFDDGHVIAGQGTMALELLSTLHDEAAVVIPVGGGGLISGMAVALKSLKPSVKIIGVQARNCRSMIHSLENGRPTTMDMSPTIADGVAVSRPGKLNFRIIQDHVDEMVDVSEEGIAGAVLDLLEKANILAEGAGAMPLAALAGGRISPELRQVVLVISGGNMETQTIDRILQRGSVRMGRRIRIAVNIPDVPGSLLQLLDIIAKARANILHILHDRLDLQNPIEVSRVILNLETRGHDHIEELMKGLADAGYKVQRIL